MNKKRLIDRLFKILPLVECLNNNEISEDNLKSYVNSQYIYIKGCDFISDLEFKEDILCYLKGLEESIIELKKEQVRKIILKIINEIDRRC